jgi:hypothetical protein
VLCAKAYVETKLFEKVSTQRPEILNQMAVCGAFMEEDDLPLRASYCIYENETSAVMVAAILLTAFGEQLAVAHALVMSDLNKSDLKKYRAHLEYPRVWPDSFNSSDDELESVAEKFRRIGLVTTTDDSALVTEVPLAEGSSSRIINPRHETALVKLSTTINHPIAGVGYYGTIALPYDPSSKNAARWANYLNYAESQNSDFVPRLGAWGLRNSGKEIVYSLFLPMNYFGSARHHLVFGTIMNWLVIRTNWLKDNYWKTGIGFESPPDRRI